MLAAAAGLHLAIRLTENLNDVDLAVTALRKGVKVQPLSWHYQHQPRPGLVLGYAGRTPTDIDRGVTTIAAALRELQS